MPVVSVLKSFLWAGNLGCLLSSQALKCGKAGFQSTTVEECSTNVCLLEFYHNQFAGGLPTCSAAGCFQGDPASLAPTAAAQESGEHSFHVCTSSDECNVLAGAASNASLCKDFLAPWPFTVNSTGNQTGTVFKGPVEGTIPMGIGNGFQFYSLGGSATGALADLLANGNPTAGYECLVKAGSPSPYQVDCRGRELRHILPTASLPEQAMKGTVWECTAAWANSTWPIGSNQKLCRYSEELKYRSLGIATGPMSFVADVMTETEADLANLTVSFQDGYYNATWLRSRAYPWELSATNMNVRWAVAPGPNDWTVGDLPFHGASGGVTGNYVRGNDFLFADPASHAARATACYDEDRHANMFASYMSQVCSTSTSTSTSSGMLNSDNNETQDASNSAGHGAPTVIVMLVLVAFSL